MSTNLPIMKPTTPNTSFTSSLGPGSCLWFFLTPCSRTKIKARVIRYLPPPSMEKAEVRLIPQVPTPLTLPISPTALIGKIPYVPAKPKPRGEGILLDYFLQLNLPRPRQITLKYVADSSLILGLTINRLERS